MVWGSFSYHGVGSLLPLEGIMNGDKYAKLVNETIKGDMMDAFPNNGGYFQQDLAPCHRAKKVLHGFLVRKKETDHLRNIISRTVFLLLNLQERFRNFS